MQALVQHLTYFLFSSFQRQSAQFQQVLGIEKDAPGRKKKRRAQEKELQESIEAAKAKKTAQDLGRKQVRQIKIMLVPHCNKIFEGEDYPAPTPAE